MRFFALLLLSGLLSTPALEAQRPRPQSVGTMSDLMAKLIYPASDSILYIESRTPETQVEWNQLVANSLIVAESANLLMMPSRALDQGQWMRDTKLMLDVGKKAYKAALEKDLPTLISLNEEMIVSCRTCHLHYRPEYGKNYKKFPPPD
jgi:hypothetical protein